MKPHASFVAIKQMHNWTLLFKRLLELKQTAEQTYCFEPRKVARRVFKSTKKQQSINREVEMKWLFFVSVLLVLSSTVLEARKRSSRHKNAVSPNKLIRLKLDSQKVSCIERVLFSFKSNFSLQSKLEIRPKTLNTLCVPVVQTLTAPFLPILSEQTSSVKNVQTCLQRNMWLIALRMFILMSPIR